MLTLTAVYVLIVVVFSAFLQTLTGFGYALAAAPLLAFAMNPKDVVMFVLFTGLVTKAILAYRTRHQGKTSSIIPIFLASVAGALPGAFVLKFISDGALKILIGIVLMAATVAMSSNVTVNIKRHGLAKTIVGLISGFLASTTSLNGPPVVMYYMNEKEEKDALRANLARYFLLGNSASLVMSYFFGTLQVNNIAVYALISMPALVIGFWLGDKIFDRMDGSVFRRIGLAVISISGLVTLGAGVWQYLPNITKAVSNLHL